MIKTRVNNRPVPLYELRAQGYCVEATAHRLTATESKKLRKRLRDEDSETNSDVGSLDDVLSSSNRTNSKIWQTSMLPLVESSVFLLFDNKNRKVFSINKISPNRTTSGESFEASDEESDVVVSFEEHRGTTSVWVVPSRSSPKMSDFKFKIGKIVTGDETREFVEAIFYKDLELGRDLDAEFVHHSAFYSRLV